MSKGTRNMVFYAGVVAVFGAAMYAVARAGAVHEAVAGGVTGERGPRTLGEGFDLFVDLLRGNVESTLGLLLLQLVVILLTCRVFGWVFRRMGQPTVVGEILAGIVLGPSVLGQVAPGVVGFLFPVESLGGISILSQFGLILFMFAIGMELNLREIREKLNETILIAHTSTIVPFFFGMLTAYFLYDEYANRELPFLSFALFIGIAMSITAFPVLARIIQERGLTRTHLGSVALASAANGDIVAWCLLAAVIAIAQAGSMLSAVYNIGFSALYIAVMFMVVRPFLRAVGQMYHNKEVVDKGMVAGMLLLLVVSCYVTEVLGLHALFGAFVAGVVMPENVKFRKIMTEKVEDVSLALFLPLFFASTGLRTEMGLISGAGEWLTCGLFIVVAIAGKFGGAMVAARVAGEGWRDSLYIGALMNTRGLMELVVLTIGYEMGILLPRVFVMLVIMTLVTTFMTTPLVGFIRFCYRGRDRREAEAAKAKEGGARRVLVSFGRAGNGPVLLRAAHEMFAGGDGGVEVTALHLTVGEDVNPLHAGNFEEESFGPILAEARRLGVRLRTRYEVSVNPGADICRVANEEGFDFLLVGAGISLSDNPDDVATRDYYSRLRRRLGGRGGWLSPGGMARDKTRVFVEQALCSVGVLVNRGFEGGGNALVVVRGREDLFLLDYARRLLATTRGKATVLSLPRGEGEEGALVTRRALVEAYETVSGLLLRAEESLSAGVLGDYGLMVVSHETWEAARAEKLVAMEAIPSTLIVKEKGGREKR